MIKNTERQALSLCASVLLPVARLVGRTGVDVCVGPGPSSGLSEGGLLFGASGGELLWITTLGGPDS